MDTIKDESIAIGIDLGTSYSCVGIYIDDHVEIIPNELGNKTTPSYVSFTKNFRLFGEEAKIQITNNPQNTIFDSKRLIGRRFSDPIVQQDIKRWPFEVQSDEQDRPLIVIESKGEIKKFFPEEISSMILTKMKDLAEKYLSKTVKNTVLTVPAYFNLSQRQATYNACVIAGLNILQIISEPIATAIAYGYDKVIQQEKNVLVFDLGGGAFDVSVIAIEDEIYEVKAVSGNNHLGGEDFDYILVDYCVTEFKKRKGLDIRSNHRIMKKLKIQCERAKRILSSSNQATIEIDGITEYDDFNIVINRTQFETLCYPLFLQCIPPIQKVLQDSKMAKDKIDEIILVGGSSRIPKIIEIVNEYFNGVYINRSINPDESVAYGAALQAAVLSGIKPKNIQNILILEVLSHSIGVPNGGGYIFIQQISRNSTIPLKKSQIFSTYCDDQPSIQLQLYESERVLIKDSRLFGTFNIIELPPTPRGLLQVEVTIDININGLIKMNAIDSERREPLKIQCTQQGILQQQEIDELVQKASKNNIEEQYLKSNIMVSKNSLQNYINQISEFMKDQKFEQRFSCEEKSRLQNLIECTLSWINLNPYKSAKSYQKQQKDLENEFNHNIL